MFRAVDIAVMLNKRRWLFIYFLQWEQYYETILVAYL